MLLSDILGSIQKKVEREVPRDLAIVETPKARTEVAVVYADANPQSLVHVIHTSDRDADLIVQDKEYVERVHL